MEAAGPPPPIYVGRENEFAVLRNMVTQLAAGVGGLAWVEGEPGIGKSTLVSRALSLAEELGCATFWASPSELPSLVPLRSILDAFHVARDASDPLIAPLATILRADVATAPVTPRDLAAVLAEHLLILVDRLCATTPVALICDDLQWADEATLSVLSRLCAVTQQAPLLVIAVCRNVPRPPKVLAVQRELLNRGAKVLALDALPPAQVMTIAHQMLEGQPGTSLVATLNQAGGNPLYVRELVDALTREGRVRLEAGVVEVVDVDVLPRSLSAAIELRLGFISEATRSILRLAALVGPAFSMDDLAAVAGRPATELFAAMAEAVTGGVLVDSGDRLTFRHGLIRQALHDGTPLSLRVALHRQAAKGLALAGAPLERVAEHVLAGPRAADNWTIDWVVNYAPALTSRAPKLSAALLEQVCEVVDLRDPRRQRADEELVLAQFELGDNDQVERLAQPVLLRSSDPSMLARICWTYVYALGRMGRYEQAFEVLDRAMRRSDLPPEWAARLQARQAMNLVGVGRYDEAREAAEKAEAMGRQADDRVAVGYALHVLAGWQMRHTMDLAAGQVTIDRALAELGDDPQATDLRLLLLGNRAACLENFGRQEEAESALGQALILAEQAGTPPRLAYLRMLSSQASFYGGKWDDALAELTAADDLPMDANYRLVAAGIRAAVAVHRDDRAAARGHLRDVGELELTAGDVRFYAELVVGSQAMLAERDGDPAAALDRLITIFDPDHTGTFGSMSIDSWVWLLEVVRLAQALGRLDLAEAAAAMCDEEARKQARPATSAAAQQCQGMLRRQPVLVLAAAQTLGEIGYPLFRANALENAAVLHAQAGDAVAAQAAYRAAIDTYTDLHAEWDIIRADTRLREFSIRRGRRGPRARVAYGWEALTPTENKIAKLVASGQSNPDIAAALFLSRRTVETHVSHILAKTNLRSRREIAGGLPR